MERVQGGKRGNGLGEGSGWKTGEWFRMGRVVRRAKGEKRVECYGSENGGRIKGCREGSGSRLGEKARVNLGSKDGG